MNQQRSLDGNLAADIKDWMELDSHYQTSVSGWQENLALLPFNELINGILFQRESRFVQFYASNDGVIVITCHNHPVQVFSRS